ncbi:MAG: hypothetical protein E6J73_03535, partial [Deltaproteobacteria bacterium]
MEIVTKSTCSALCLSVMIVLASPVFAAADPVEEILKEQTKARQEQKIKEQQRQEQIENLKRDRD